jgi:hypothetical protein
MADPVRRSTAGHVGAASPPEAAPAGPPPRHPPHDEQGRHTVAPFPKSRGLPSLVPADETVRAAKNMKEAIALANELLPMIQGVHQIPVKRVVLDTDDQGRVRQKTTEELVRIDLSRTELPSSISGLGPPADSRTRYGETPVLGTDRFGVDLAQAAERGVELTAKTLIHEWAHTAVNRGLMAQPDPRQAYDAASSPIGTFESLKFKSPVTGEYVRVEPSGRGITDHEMVAQFVEHLFDKVLAERKKAHR